MNKNQIEILSIQEIIWLSHGQFILNSPIRTSITNFRGTPPTRNIINIDPVYYRYTTTYAV